ncbi:SMI1/KNR4 family protein [Pseudanabaena sp. 'Roaring Creek']|uniref:SMI1/KNR4 family protein n=1 Tax=Pseudanabaena sp. 'Roaring Creek' TaxID=1681830 RepID=UPI0006D84B37|nr:SMI1/KNR4 family protein [Pseudanabaena sp. 'Roaring Creek']
MSLTNALSRIDTFLSQNYPAQFAKLGGSLSEEQINDLGKDIPCVLSKEVRELYKWHNGSGYSPIWHNYYYISSLQDAVEMYEILSTFPDSWELSFFSPFIFDEIEFLFVDCNKEESPVWYIFWEDMGTEMLWTSLTKMMESIAEAYETGAYYFDNDDLVTDNKKFLEIMWRKDPDIISSLTEHLRTVKENRLNHISCGYKSMERFVWQDIAELFNAILGTSDNSARVEMLQEFTSIFLDECDRIINTP